MTTLSHLRLLVPALLIAGLAAACSQNSDTPESQPAAASIEAPAGQYRLDPNHASVSVSVQHLGLSNYKIWFTEFNVDVSLDPANLAASTVKASVDPTSVTTDYSGDYKATHKDSPYNSWNEALAQSPKFLQAKKHPKISFVSTKVEPTGKTTAKIHGNLKLLGQSHPLVLDASVVGSAAKHPFTGVGAIGFSAVGHFKRSDFGMNHLLQPLLVSDRVTIHFDGEFQQVTDPAN